MKPRFVEAASDVLRGLFFSGHTADRSRLVKTVNTLLKISGQIDNKLAVSFLSENDVRRRGLKALVHPLSGIHSQIQGALASLREKDDRIAELEEMVAGLKTERSELASQVASQEEQLQESHTSEQSQVRQRQELENLLSAVVNALEQDSCQSIVAENVSEDIQGLARAIHSSMQSLHNRSMQRSQHQESENRKLVAALQQIARGEIPGDVADETTSTTTDMMWIKSAAVTLQEVYAGNASVSITIQESMDMLFTIAGELSDDAAQQMIALQELQKTVAQISQNTVTMTHQTDETAKAAQEIHRLTDSLMNEAEEMISAVRESHKNIGDISELMDQSSLLALNARIIAAQAGEHGRGFAVVAEAIKDLSTQTDTFVQLITERVQAITNSTTTVHEGVQHIAKSMGAVQQNTDQIASGTYEYSASTSK
jgi:methyl-accepting chemotaxis protein